jgi:hypothetical protein
MPDYTSSAFLRAVLDASRIVTVVIGGDGIVRFASRGTTSPNRFRRPGRYLDSQETRCLITALPLSYAPSSTPPES